MKMEKEDEVRKGPWTEEEDVQLVFYVNLFGDRRWDFIAKVSGIKRTGKSCRLRWVNYLNPSLKRGKLTPNEQRLVLDLHSKLGNRWSRIARKIPGRTDNEIKNYWRTHMRKKAQEKKKSLSHSSPSSSSSSSSISSSSSSQVTETTGRRFYDTGGKDLATAPVHNMARVEAEEITKVYSMDEIWKDIELSEESSKGFTCQALNPPTWDFPPTDDSLWSMNEEESKMLMMMHHMVDHYHSFPYYNHMTG